MPYAKGARRPHAFDPRSLRYAFRFAAGQADLSKDVSILPFVPPVKNQGSEGSCTAQALTSAMETNYHVITGQTPVPRSRAAAYWLGRHQHDLQHPGDQWATQDSGCVPAEICDACLAGLPPETDWAYPEPVALPPPATVLADVASGRWMGSHQPIFPSQAPVEGLWLALAQKLPVIIGMAFPPQWEDTRNGEWTAAQSPTPPGQCSEGHELLVAKRNAATRKWVLPNSWDTTWNTNAAQADPEARPGMAVVAEDLILPYIFDYQVIHPADTLVPPTPGPQPVPPQTPLRDVAAAIAHQVAVAALAAGDRDGWYGAETVSLTLRQDLPLTATEADCLTMALYVYNWLANPPGAQVAGRQNGAAAAWWKIHDTLPLPAGADGLAGPPHVP